MISKKTWDKLPNDVRLAVMASAGIAQEYERRLFVDEEKSLFKDLQDKYGVHIYHPADLNKWRTGISSVYEKNAKKVGGMDYIKKIQGL
jgi:TRAP-type C4-dicarboxylate transport system substrate-binding protein